MASGVKAVAFVIGKVTLVLLLIISFLFIALRTMQGNPVDLLLDHRLTPEIRETIKKGYGYDGSPTEQYVRFVRNIVTGDMGVSFTHGRPVYPMLREAILLSSWLGLFSMTLGLVFAMILIWCQSHLAPPWLQQTASVFVSVGLVLPAFLVAVMLLGLARYWDFLPLYGTVDLFARDLSAAASFGQLLRHTLLPGLSVAIPLGVHFSVYLVRPLQEAHEAPFSLSARGRGLSKTRVYFFHEWRYVAPILVQLAGLYLPGMMTGVLVVEAIFGWQGLGTLLMDALLSRDYPLLLGGTLWAGFLVILGYESADRLRLHLAVD